MRNVKSSSKVMVLYIVISLIIILAIKVMAQGITCSISSICSNTAVLYMKNETGGYYNAHAQLPSVANYPYILCCSSTETTLSNTCSDAIVLKLYATTNSHVQWGNYSGPYTVYSNNACLSADPGTIECIYQNSCPANYECLISMASSESWAENKTNAHVGPCSEYSMKVCCRFIGLPVIKFVNPTPLNATRRINNQETINASVSGSSDIDTCLLEWNGVNETMNMLGSGTSVYCYKTKTTTDGTTYTYRVYANDTAGNLNVSEERTFRENAKPTITSIAITPTNAYTTSDLNCSVSGWSDSDGDAQHYHFKWYNGSELKFVFYNVSQFYFILLAGNTTKNEQWNCTVTAYDTYENGSVLSAVKTILNTPPTQPQLDQPANNTHIINRTPKFNWTHASDADNDAITYQFQLCLISDCSSTIENITGISNNYYIIDYELDLNTDYYWRVRAYDGQDYGQWSGIYTFVIDSYVDISMINDKINFGTLIQYDIEATDDGSPEPFKIENTGNTEINITVNATPLWSSFQAPLDTYFYQFKANNSEEQNSFNWQLSQTTWENMSSSEKLVIAYLNHTDSNDLAAIDLRVEVPGDEPPGNKQSTVYFYAGEA